jgi:hypothetical protein
VLFAEIEGVDSTSISNSSSGLHLALGADLGRRQQKYGHHDAGHACILGDCGPFVEQEDSQKYGH